MIIRGEGDLERLQADGTITPADADEVRAFGDFLEALAAARASGEHVTAGEVHDRIYGGDGEGAPAGP